MRLDFVRWEEGDRKGVGGAGDPASQGPSPGGQGHLEGLIWKLIYHLWVSAYLSYPLERVAYPNLKTVVLVTS